MAARLSRRGLLKIGGGVAAAATAAGLAVYGGAATSHAEVPSSPKFVLNGAGGNPVWRKKLHMPKGWAMQMFGFDTAKGHMYFVQHQAPTDPDNPGDLWINRTDMAGKELGAMFLRKFGHGSGMVVEPTSGAPRIWIEGSDLNPVNGAGEKGCYLTYKDGATVDYVDDNHLITDRTPTIDSFAKLPRPAYDPLYKRLMYRYATHEPAQRVWRIALFSMEDAKNGRLGQGNRIAERAIPNNAELGLSDKDYFQGIVPCGQYAYLLFGRGNSKSWIVVLDMNDTGGSMVEKIETRAGASLPGREPEGISIWMVDGKPRLAFGFSSKIGTDPTATFEASVFYKSEFV